MPGVSGMATTFTLPNFVGQLHKVTAEDTSLLAMAGGLSGGDEVFATDVPFSTIDNEDASQPEILEGADPVFSERSREESGNVVQIFQYGIKHSYTNLASRRNLGVPGTAPSFPVLGDVQVNDELALQISLKLAKAARDVEWSFWRGEYQRPTSNSSARKTRGLANVSGMTEVALGTRQTNTAITAATDDVSWTSHGLSVGDEVYFSAKSTGAPELDTNVRYYVHTVTSADAFSLTETLGGAEIDISVNAAGTGWTCVKPAAWAKENLDYLLQKMYEDSEAPMMEPVVFSGIFNKTQASDTYGIAPRDRNIGGLNIEVVETDMGKLPWVVSRFAPVNTIWIIDMAFIKPAYLRIPDHGHFFLEPVARTGAYEALQLYGEIGLQHGPGQFHGKLTGVTSIP